jgi:hypothetical protein
MNLVELLAASVIVVGSSAGSLQLWNQMMHSARQQDQLQRVSDQLDAELVSIEASLRRLGLSMVSPPPCGQAAQVLQGQLVSTSVSPGLVRELSVTPTDDVLQVVVSAPDHPWKRRRLIRPAAIGLCTLPEPEALSSPALTQSG